MDGPTLTALASVGGALMVLAGGLFAAWRQGKTADTQAQASVEIAEINSTAQLLIATAPHATSATDGRTAVLLEMIEESLTAQAACRSRVAALTEQLADQERANSQLMLEVDSLRRRIEECEKRNPPLERRQSA